MQQNPEAGEIGLCGFTSTRLLFTSAQSGNWSAICLPACKCAAFLANETVCDGCVKGGAVMGFFIVFVVVPLGLVYFLCVWADERRADEIEQRRQEAEEFEPVARENTKSNNSARWVSEDAMQKAGLFNGVGWFLGFSSESGRAMRWAGNDGHSCLIAPTGAGKGVCVQLFNMLWGFDDYSVVCIDPKGEMAAVSGEYRSRLGPVYVLNPYGILREELNALQWAQYNPMSRLNPDDVINFGPLAAKQADGIVWQDEIGTESKHWSKNSRKGIHGLIMALAQYGAAREKNLVRVAEIISTGEIWDYCLWVMKKNPDTSIRQRVAKFAVDPAKVENKGELASIISTMDTEVDFLGDAAIAQSLRRSSFQFSDLKKRVCTVFIILPLDYLEISSRYFRLLVSCALSELIDPAARGSVRTVMMLDEFYQYGALSAVDNAMRMARGSRVQLFPVVTSIGDLKARYPQTWRSFLSNSVVRMFMAAQDDETAEYMAGECGDREMVVWSQSVREDRTRGPYCGLYDVDVSYSMSGQREPLLNDHQARSLHANEMLVMLRGLGSIPARRVPFFKIEELRQRARPNPYVENTGGRKELAG
jgi:type IV secretion system protein VirD4